MVGGRTVSFAGLVDDAERSQASGEVGILLLNGRLRLVHHTGEAAAILEYPKKPKAMLCIDKVLPCIRSQLTPSSHPLVPGAVQFQSGRRRYHCRAFLLDSGRRFRLDEDDSFEPRIVAVLERVMPRFRDLTDWFDAFQLGTWCHEFQLTGRESETVKLILRGLTSKEIADLMGISPSTVKSYVKLVMTKVGASTRTGIVAKMLEESPLSR